MLTDRVKNKSLQKKIRTAKDATLLFRDGMVVASSGFTKGGDSKVVLPALAERAREERLQIFLMTGASLGNGTDGILAEAGVLKRRLPFQSDPILRKKINEGQVLFTDLHLGEVSEFVSQGVLPAPDIAILEVAEILEDGSVVPTTSVGNNLIYARTAKHLILEVNLAVPVEMRGFHDLLEPMPQPGRQCISILRPGTRAGQETFLIDPEKVLAVVESNQLDSAAELQSSDEGTTSIACHLMNFFEYEVKRKRLPTTLLPLQSGIGKVANAVLSGFKNGPFEGLTMYSEVLQDSVFELIDAGKMDFASASSMTLSQDRLTHFFSHLKDYRDRILLRPQNISNSAEVIRRLGIISMNTALEFDIYGNVNSTHVGGTHIMNGIGGSAEFARNAYLSVFVCQSASKQNRISHVVPMVPHIDNIQQDVDILVSDRGLADLRGLAPRERARLIIQNCAHPDYQAELSDYFDEACKRGGQTPHLLGRALSFHERFNETGSMNATNWPLRLGRP